MLFEPSRNRILHEGSNGLPDQDRSRTTRSRRGERTHKQSGQVRVCEPSRKNCANLPDNYHRLTRGWLTRSTISYIATLILISKRPNSGQVFFSFRCWLTRSPRAVNTLPDRWLTR